MKIQKENVNRLSSDVGVYQLSPVSHPAKTIWRANNSIKMQKTNTNI